MKILAIETSCDETAVSILECSGDAHAPKCEILGTGLYSQAHKHAQYGGVYPNLARREHQQNLIPMLAIALQNAHLTPYDTTATTTGIKHILEKESTLLEQLIAYLAENPNNPGIDAIAVTQGPGLEPALWVGLNFAKALSHAWHIPLIPVNHMEGHIVSVLTESQDVSFPAVALLVSGGHTELQLVHDWGQYELLGQTRDDAVGEAFDKVARLLGLPYPGGPEISRLAGEARKTGEPPMLSFPRPMMHTNDYDFSYAGLKTAVLYKIKELGMLTDELKKEIAWAFEDAAIEVLVIKTKRALEKTNAHTLIVGGGVIANTYLREQLTKMLANFPAVNILFPTRELSTDNAVMIGIAGYIAHKKTPSQFGIFTTDQTLRAHGTLRLNPTKVKPPASLSRAERN